MTREELVRQMTAITQALDTRVEVWRVVIGPDGREMGRIYRGAARESNVKQTNIIKKDKTL